MRISRQFLVTLVLGSTLSAQGNILAVSWTGGSSLINSATGTSTSLGASGATNLNSLAYSPVTNLYYTVGGSATSTSPALLYTINPVTGAATNTGITLSASDVRGLAITPANVCYAIINGTPDKLYTVNLATGLCTFVGNTGNSSVQALASDNSGALYGWAVAPSTVSIAGLLSINPSTGVATAIGSSSAAIQGLAFSPSGVLYGCGGSLYTINTLTGATTTVGAGGLGDVRGIEFTNHQGTVTFSPQNGQVGALGVLQVVYSAPGHGLEAFIAVPSCTLGSFFTPPLPGPLAVAWDVCTDFYFTDPSALTFMPLSGVPGSTVGTLDSSGSATGMVLPPGYLPPGLNLPVYITFVSWNTTTYVITVHGVGTFTLI